jgi:plastocyanin
VLFCFIKALLCRQCQAVTVNLDWHLSSDLWTSITVGDTVVWTWTDSASHSVQSLGSPSFSSSETKTGTGNQHSVHFTVAGDYMYNCLVHGNNMQGVVSVGDITASPTGSLAKKTKEPSFAPSAAPVTVLPTLAPALPSSAPTVVTVQPSPAPTVATAQPSLVPSEAMGGPSRLPSQNPSSVSPSSLPTMPSGEPTIMPSGEPTAVKDTSNSPTEFFSAAPTTNLTTQSPTLTPTLEPTRHMHIVQWETLGGNYGVMYINAGDIVVWMWSDSAPHNVRSVDEKFASSPIFTGVGNTYEVTFYDPGTYPYDCSMHPQMQGVIVVRGTTGSDESEDTQKSRTINIVLIALIVALVTFHGKKSRYI